MVTYVSGAVGLHVLIEDGLGVERIGRVVVAGVVLGRVCHGDASVAQRLDASTVAADGCMRGCCAGATLSFVGIYSSALCPDRRRQQECSIIIRLLLRKHFNVYCDQSPVAVSWFGDTPSR